MREAPTKNAAKCETESDAGQSAPHRRGLCDDERADPRMVAALSPFGLDQAQPEPDVSASSPREQLLAYVAEVEAGFGGVFAALLSGLPPVQGVTRTAMKVQGPDGNGIELYLHRPAGRPATAALPCVVHFHGGGGVILSAADPCYERFRDELAAAGTMVVGVEFRNAAGKLGNHPYPAGLTDCAAATEWVLAHRSELGVANVVVAGESGGGNLALAVALKANRDGWSTRPDGVYAIAPMLASPWNKPLALASQTDNDGYLISCALLAIMGALYDPLDAHGRDPLCWPYHAGDDDLCGLPPHVISVNELDPLRDEGLAYQRRLVGNGVSAVGRTLAGTVHAADVFFRAAMPDVYAATIRDLCGFARQP
jgi:acetyl esterase/lipase